MKLILIAFLFLFSTLAFATTPQDKYDDAVAKAQIDYKRAQKECKTVPDRDKSACTRRVQQMWQQVNNGLKKQHFGVK